MNKKIGGALLVVAAVALFIALGGYFLKNKHAQNYQAGTRENYVIPGVPYFGKHNQKGDAAYISGDSQSALASVLKYWDPEGTDLKDIYDYMSQMGNFTSPEQLRNYFYSKKGYLVSSFELKSIDDIRQFVNPDKKTPLIAFLPVGPDQPSSIRYRPASVIIGVKDDERKIVLHSYWFGNNYELSYDDLEKMKTVLPSGGKLSLVVIVPENSADKLKEIAKRSANPYPARTSVMTEGQEMLKDYAYAQGAWLADDGRTGLQYGLKIINNSKFENYFPPFFKMEIYSMLAGFSLGTKNINDAFTYANKSIDMDHDLNKPFRDYPGHDFPFGRDPNGGSSPHPYSTRGDIYSTQGNYAKAYDDYMTALGFDKNDKRASFGEAAAKSALDKK